MKTMRSFINGLAVTGIALAMASTLSAQTVTQGKVKVIKMKGEARYTAGASGWKTLHTGDVLEPGTVIQTETKRGSFVDLLLMDNAGGSTTIPVSFNPSYATPPAAGGGGGGGVEPAITQNIVRLWENTVFGVDKLTSQDTGANMVTDTQLDLKAGHILGAVKKMAPASRYEIKLPNGVAGIRGTVYEINLLLSPAPATRHISPTYSVYSGGPMVLSLLKDTGSSGNPPPSAPVETIVLDAGKTYTLDTGLLTDIPQSVINRILRLIHDITPSPTPVFVPAPAPNTTLYYVSPTK
jgi:hypothetical protein